MLTTICKTPRFTNLMKARLIKASCTTIAAGTLFVCVSSVSLCAQAQVQPRKPVQKPEVPPMPQAVQPMPQWNGPSQPVYVPAPPYQQPLPLYQPPVYQPQLGSMCYAGSVSGPLGQFAPIGLPCSVFAYGIQYPGVVGQ
jgi:hypothetical protein